MTDGGVPVDREVAKTSLTLLDRARARDPEAWKRLVHLYGPLVYFWCRQLGLQEANAADVGQEVFLAVSRGIGTFEHDRKGATFRGWLKTITRNKVADFARRMPPGGEGEGGSDAQARLLQAVGADSDSDAADLEDRQLLLHQAIESHLAGCTEETRQAFLRVVIGRQDPAHVAEELGLTPNAVYLLKSRIMRQLRDEYADLIDLD